LINSFIEAVVEFPLFIALLLREWPYLSPDTQRYCLTRRETYLASWHTAVAATAPWLSEAEVKLTVHLIFSLVCSVTSFHSGGPRDVADVVRDMVKRALPRAPRAARSRRGEEHRS